MTTDDHHAFYYQPALIRTSQNIVNKVDVVELLTRTRFLYMHPILSQVDVGILHGRDSSRHGLHLLGGRREFGVEPDLLERLGFSGCQGFLPSLGLAVRTHVASEGLRAGELQVAYVAFVDASHVGARPDVSR